MKIVWDEPKRQANLAKHGLDFADLDQESFAGVQRQERDPMNTFDPEHAAANGYTKADWDEVADNPEWTAEDFRNARPFSEVFPELAASARRMRGAQKASTKEAVSIRLSRDVLARLRAGGPGWQTRLDEMLRKAVGL